MNFFIQLFSRSLKKTIRTSSLARFANDANDACDNKAGNEKIESDQETTKMPEIPVTCCGTGCQNCVWLEYADQLLNYYNHKQARTKQSVNVALDEINKLSDENLKAYLSMELKNKFKNIVDK